MKKCNKCLEEKDLYFFEKVSKNAYRGSCRKCRNTPRQKKFYSNPENVEKRRIKMREYMRDKYNNDPDYKRYSSLLNKVYKLIRKEPIKSLFELKFDDKMNWDNYGIYWEVDHILPVLKMVRLGYSDEEINDIKNIRPLSIVENKQRSKR